MSLRFASTSLAIALGVVATFNVACTKKETGTSPAPSTSASATVATAPQPSAPPAASAPTPRPIRGGSASAMLLNAARSIELKEPQKAALASLETKLRDDGPPKTELKELETELAAQVRAGKIDNAKLKPKHDALEKLSDAKHERDMETIAALHAALEPAQRKAVTANVRAKQAERDQRLAKRKEREDKPDPAARTKMRVERMTRDLGLDAAQQKALEGAIQNEPKEADEAMADAKKRTEALLVAFEQDKFDAKKLADLKPKKRAAGRLGSEEDMLAKLVPALKPEQREKLAAKMEGQGHGGRKRGHGGDDDDD